MEAGFVTIFSNDSIVVLLVMLLSHFPILHRFGQKYTLFFIVYRFDVKSLGKIVQGERSAKNAAPTNWMTLPLHSPEVPIQKQTVEGRRRMAAVGVRAPQGKR